MICLQHTFCKLNTDLDFTGLSKVTRGLIIGYGSAFVTYEKITETKLSRKESSFPAEVPLIKLIFRHP